MALRRSAALNARRKHFQKAWSPNATKGGAAPINGVTAQEALQIAYRPMRLDQTVEYEEDFGDNLMIHREFISKKYRKQMSFDISPLTYSDLELSKAKERLANSMNSERKSVLIGGAGNEADRVHMNVDVDDDTREIKSARYLFSDVRMRYCGRFQEFFTDAIRKSLQRKGIAFSDDAEDDQPLFSLMEACAIIFGCSTQDAAEVYYRQFLNLDRDTLSEEEEALKERLRDAEKVKAMLSSRSKEGEKMLTPADGSKNDAQLQLSSSVSLKEAVKDLPSLFDDEEDDEDSISGAAKALTESSPENSKAEEGALEETSEIEVSEAYAPLYKAFLEHASGQRPVTSYDYSSLGATDRLRERQRWRRVMEKLVNENYLQLTDDEIRDAVILNHQLHTIKFFDLKIGDTVREIMQLLQRETGQGSSANRDRPLEVSEYHPERRV